MKKDVTYLYNPGTRGSMPPHIALGAKYARRNC